MFERSVGKHVVLAATLLLVGCGHPQQRVVDGYFGAINAGDNQTIGSFAAYKFDRKVDKWRIISSTEDATVDAPLPGLTQQLAAAQEKFDKAKKDMQLYANEHYNDYDQVKQLQAKGGKIPPNLAEMSSRLEEWGKTERELKRQMADSKAAAEAEKRLVQLSVGPEVKDIETLPADMTTKDLELGLTVGGQEQTWIMHLRKYEPKQSTGQRVISRWVIQNMEPKK